MRIGKVEDEDEDERKDGDKLKDEDGDCDGGEKENVGEHKVKITM